MGYTSIVRDTYNKVAKKYFDSRGAFHNEEQLEKFIELAIPGGTVLDLGCGSGVPVDRFLVDKGFKVTGLDISEEQIKLAKKYVPEAVYVVKNMSDLTEGEYSVDAVVSFYAIFHVPRVTQQDLFKKIYSYLKVGGPLLVTMATTDWEGVDENFYGEKMYESHFGPIKNSQMVKEASFEIMFNDIDTTGNEKHQIILARKV